MVGINSCILSLVWSDASHCKIVDHLLWNFRQNLSGQIRSSKLSKSRRKVSAGQGPNILVKNIYRVYQYSLKGLQYLVTLNQSIAGTCTCVEYRIIYKWSRALAQRGVKSYQVQLYTCRDKDNDKIIAVVITAIFYKLHSVFNVH